MTIDRDYSLSPVQDFRLNVKPKLAVDDVPEEKYENGELVGWNIKKLRVS